MGGGRCEGCALVHGEDGAAAEHRQDGGGHCGPGAQHRRRPDLPGADQPHQCREALGGCRPECVCRRCRQHPARRQGRGQRPKAQHTAVFVPGTGTVFAGVPGQMDHIRRLQKAAEDKAGDENVAVVSWLGYETPNWLDGSVAQSDRGDAGAPLLRNFTKGLRVAEGDNGVCSHLTLMGHSYGSYVVGVAARDAGGANANDILALGSPGMGVEGAWQLNVDPKHVWVGTAKDDFIQTFTGTVLGDGPQYRDFDAQRIQIDTSGHGGYWDFGPGGASESLQNQGRIIAGRPPTLAPRYPR
ncbi:alpha/beta hydrolase [Streptomyces sp. 1331.2]|uniref:alpha/beta hydrolase n=1 Tax=Streptomyces sp. 1331.2 TaxID=1938835 RepID=UPI000BE44412|nr:alpha/beta hydrolase [Streptomyces sp. 1331.2]